LGPSRKVLIRSPAHIVRFLMMKKFTIITPPELSVVLLSTLGRENLTHLTEIDSPDFERLRMIRRKDIDYGVYRDRLRNSYAKLLESETFEVSGSKISVAELVELGKDPESMINKLVGELEGGKAKLEKAATDVEEAKTRLVAVRARLETLRALQPDELKRCLAVGVLKSAPEESQRFAGLSRIQEHLARFEDVTHRLVEISPNEGFIFVFGPEERRSWVEALLTVFDVKDIFEALNVRDVLLALDVNRRQESLKEYIESIEALQKYVDNQGEIAKVKAELSPVVARTLSVDNYLSSMSGQQAPVLRTDVMSVVQGWVPEDKIPRLQKAIRDVEEKTGESFLMDFEEPGHEEPVPTLKPELKPRFLDPAWKLTSLRGWPSAHEVNPALVTVIIFSFQFGLMFGDVGQGLLLLVLGLFISRKYKTGMMSKLGVMFVPMGISAIVFGFLYGEVFLVEGLIHPLLFNPMEEGKIGSLMKMILGIAVVELCAGLVIGMINAYKSGNKWGMLGEHGLGFILTVVGLYFGALYFLQTDSIFALMSHWSVIMMVVGLALSFLEPVITSFTVHRKLGFEAVGEGIGGFLLVFVESLSNFFSFLRIAAFALAHASLAVAAHAMQGFIGFGGIVLMNVIAMTFEFISSSVQSLRLLYYEFMGKFFHGNGVEFKPFSIKTGEIQDPGD